MENHANVLAVQDALESAGAGGVPRAVFPITYAELVRITAGTPVEVA
jgi:hypothetical protein